MKLIWILCCTGCLVACTAHHAASVRCDSKLRPINAPVAAGPLADTAASKNHAGVP
jgi:hypothetical protein